MVAEDALFRSVLVRYIGQETEREYVLEGEFTQTNMNDIRFMNKSASDIHTLFFLAMIDGPMFRQRFEQASNVSDLKWGKLDVSVRVGFCKSYGQMAIGVESCGPHDYILTIRENTE